MFVQILQEKHLESFFLKSCAECFSIQWRKIPSSSSLMISWQFCLLKAKIGLLFEKYHNTDNWIFSGKCVLTLLPLQQGWNRSYLCCTTRQILSPCCRENTKDQTQAFCDPPAYPCLMPPASTQSLTGFCSALPQRPLGLSADRWNLLYVAHGLH